MLFLVWQVLLFRLKSKLAKIERTKPLKTGNLKNHKNERKAEEIVSLFSWDSCVL